MAWTFEDKFNSDTKSTGDLNGQDGWSGGTGTDVVTTTPYEGDQCVSGGDEAQITRTFTAVNSGVVYFAMRRSTTSGDAEMDFRANSNTQLKIRFMFNSGVCSITNGGSTSTVIASFSTGVWYLFELTINSDDTHAIRYHNGTSWSTPITGLAAATGVTADIDAIRISGGTPGAALYDCITPTNPISESVSVTVSAGVNAATFSIPTYTPKINISLSRSTLSAVFSIPTYTILSGGALYVATVVSSTFSVVSSSVKISVSTAISTLAATFSAIVSTVGLGVTTSLSTVSATFTTVVLAKVGSAWTKISRNSTGTWTRSSRNDD